MQHPKELVGTPHVLAIDPGLKTGIAVCDNIGIQTMQLDVEEFYRLIRSYGYMNRWRPLDAIVCEAYIISPDTLKKSRQHWSLELIGLTRYEAYLAGVNFKLQQASAAKKFVTNDLLKLYGLYVPGQDHANDALRHLVLYLVQQRSLAIPEGI